MPIDGTVDGPIVGVSDGTVDGTMDGRVDGTNDGASDGIVDGRVLGTNDGVSDGTVDGRVDGVEDSDFDGTEVAGALVGAALVEGPTELDGAAVTGAPDGAAVTGALEGDVVSTANIDRTAVVTAAFWDTVFGTSVGEFELKLLPGEGLAVKSKHSSKKNKLLSPKAINGEVLGISALQKFHTSPPATFEQSTL
jgi:hypothetical protein